MSGQERKLRLPVDQEYKISDAHQWIIKRHMVGNAGEALLLTMPTPRILLPLYTRSLYRDLAAIHT